MIVTNNPLMFPFVILIWSLDAYLLLASVRLTAGQVQAVRTTRWYGALRQLVDGGPDHVRRRLGAHHIGNGQAWVAWAVVIVVVITVRYLCLGIVMAMS